MKVVPLLLFILLHFGSPNAQQSNWSLPGDFDPLRDPFQDLKMATDLADSTGKRIILDVGGTWCVWCHRMDDFINSHEELKNLIDENFIWLKVNFSKENKNEEFLGMFPEIAGYPHLFVLESDGTLLHSQNTGELEKDKDYDLQKFMDFIIKWEIKNRGKD
ncbi:MAG: thioredoxin family protein [Ignavibacteriaceae bacterium]